MNTSDSKRWWLVQDQGKVLAVSSSYGKTSGWKNAFLNNNQKGHSYEVEELTDFEAKNVFKLSDPEMASVLNLDREIFY